MNKMMPLEILSSIKNAKPSEAVEDLFVKIKNTVNHGGDSIDFVKHNKILELEMLREDKVQKAEDTVIEFIKQNFPIEKNGYLVVPRVIEE